MPDTFDPIFRTVRGRGAYVLNIRYPSGAVGCVVRDGSRGYAVACPWDEDSGRKRFRSRTDAARYEHAHVLTLTGQEN